MQGLNPFARGQGDRGRPAPVRHAPLRPEPTPQRAARRDPAPSRLAYRLNRMMLRPIMRRLVHIGIPAFLAVLVAGIWLSDETRRANLTGGIDSIVDKVQHREAFMVKMMTIEGASPVVDKGLRAMLPVALPASSFDIDLDNLRERVLKLDAVEAVELRIKPGAAFLAAVYQGTLLLGLSGNPSAAAVAFFLLGIPALRRIGGWEKAELEKLQLQPL